MHTGMYVFISNLLQSAHLTHMSPRTLYGHGDPLVELPSSLQVYLSLSVILSKVPMITVFT